MTAPKPRVLMLAPHFPPEGGAASARLGSFATELGALGHELRVVAPEPSYLVPAPGRETSAPRARRMAVAPRGHGALANAWHQWRLRAALREGAREELLSFDADVVLVSSPPPVAALAGLGLVRRDGAPLPVVLDVRDLWPDVLIEAGLCGARSPAAFVLRGVERRLLSQAAAVVAVTRTKERRLAAKGARRLRLVVNGVEEEWTAPEPAYRGGGSPFVVLHAGNIGRAQDLSLLAKSLAPGEGTALDELSGLLLGDGEERDLVLALAQRLGARLAWEPPVPRREMPERLASCGCAFVSLRTSAMVDAVPSKLLDAMARGVPVVLAAAGESAELLEEARAGLVVAPGDAPGLRRALVTMRDMGPARRREMGSRGREHVLARFRRRDAARELSAALEEACA